MGFLGDLAGGIGDIAGDLVGGVLGKKKDTSWEATVKGIEDSVRDARRLGQNPTELSQAGKYGLLANKIAKDQGLGSARQANGGAINGQRGVLGNQMMDEDSAIRALIDQQANDAKTVGRDINTQDEQAYNAQTRLLPGLIAKRDDTRFKTDLSNEQAKANKPSMWDTLGNVANAGTNAYIYNKFNGSGSPSKRPYPDFVGPMPRS